MISYTIEKSVNALQLITCLLLYSAQIALGASVPSDYISACTTTAIPKPDLFGAEILSLTAAEVQNETISVTQTDSHFAVNLTGLNFCNVSITYTHPGYNDEIHVQVWLPLDSWNGRFLGTGGGGWAESEGYPALAYGVSQGYATVASDGGHSIYELTPESWALISLGNVNWYLLQDFASLALDDMTILGKAVTQSFYGKAAEYSYWNVCATVQCSSNGLMLTLFAGLLNRWPARPHASPTLSHQLRWHPCGCTCYQLGQLHRRRVLGSAVDEPPWCLSSSM